MSLHGEFKTFPLPDLLQWLENSRKSGRLIVTSGGGEKLFLLAPEGIARYGAVGLYERLARIFQLLGVLDEPGGVMAVGAALAGSRCEDAFEAAGVSPDLVRELARDDAMQTATDLFEDAQASFHFADEVDEEGEETAAVGLPLREMLYEAARRADEAGPAAKQIGSDASLLFPTGKTAPAPKGLAAAALAAVGPGATVGSVRLALGLSSTGASRILFELWRDGLLRRDGAEAPRHDPLTVMLAQGEQLLKQGHYEAAALVFNSLLAADPSDRRVREFARAVEREHVDVLYRKLVPMAVPKMVAAEAALTALRQDERIVAAMVNDRWDVSTLVLASPMRELQTLRALERMVELGFLSLDR